jgi:C4-dicarboxylate-specific signal transduction histidine kinase
MTFLHSVVSIPMGWIVAAAIAGTTLVVLWIATLLSRRWYITIRKSEETEVIHYYLRRIAESLERLAAARELAATQETQSPPAPVTAPADTIDAEAARPVGMSMFGR